MFIQQHFSNPVHPCKPEDKPLWLEEFFDSWKGEYICRDGVIFIPIYLRLSDELPVILLGFDGSWIDGDLYGNCDLAGQVLFLWMSTVLAQSKNLDECKERLRSIACIGEGPVGC